MSPSKINFSAVGPSVGAGMSFGSRVWRMLTLGHRLGRRTALVLWTATAIGLGLFAGWGWIIAAGLSSTVLALLPCAAMCALGLCGGDSAKKCSEKPAPSGASDKAQEQGEHGSGTVTTTYNSERSTR